MDSGEDSEKAYGVGSGVDSILHSGVDSEVDSGENSEKGPGVNSVMDSVVDSEMNSGEDSQINSGADSSGECFLFRISRFEETQKSGFVQDLRPRIPESKNLFFCKICEALSQQKHRLL